MKKIQYIILLIGCFIPLSGFAQISSNADFIEKTEYSDFDSIHVFCTSDLNGGSLIAADSSGIGHYSFEWFKYDEGTNSFNIPLTGFSINTDSTVSTISNLSSGGYKVVLTADTVQEYIAWIYNNTNLSIDVRIIDPLDCELLELNGTPNFVTGFTYFNPAGGAGYDFENSKGEYKWEFTSDGEVNIPEYNYSYTSTVDLPLEDTKCKLILIDRFGCETSDSVNYTAIATKADLKMTVLDRDGNEVSSGDTSVTGEAPLVVKFTNESKRGYEFVWFFGDTLVKDDDDYITTTDFNLQPEHTYYYTEKELGKKYTAKLVSESEYGCMDSIPVYINIDPSKFEFPNVFSPNGDTNNDIFIIDPENFKSIRSFKITIFNRSGQLMHEYEGDIHDWKGWDGTVRGKGKASEGTYFFVLEVTGWDDVKYNNNTLGKESSFGFIGLYR